MRTVSFLGSDIQFHELERDRWRFKTLTDRLRAVKLN